MKKFIERCLCSVSLTMILLLASCSNETSNETSNNKSKQQLLTVVQGDTEFNHLDRIIRCSGYAVYRTEDGKHLVVAGTYYEIEEEK